MGDGVRKATYPTPLPLFNSPFWQRATVPSVFRLPTVYQIQNNKASLKPLQNLQPMERRRLADIFPINKIMLN